MLKGEHSAIILTFINLPVVIKTFVLSIFGLQFYIVFTVYLRNEFQFWNVHGIMNTSGLLQS